MSPSPPRSPLARPLLAVALAALVTWPLVELRGARLIGDPDGDVWNHAWGPWWWASALRQGELPWRTDALGAPQGGVLWFIDPMLAATGAALSPILGFVSTYNISVLLFVTLAALGAARFARALGAAPIGEATAAIAVCASGPLRSAIHNGTTEALHLGLLALALALGERAVHARRDGPWLAAGAAVGALVGLSPYLGLGAAIALAIRAAPALRAPRGPMLGLATALALAAPGLMLLSASLSAPDALLQRPPAMNEGLALMHAVDPRELLRPLAGPARPEPGFVHASHLGWAALALAVAAGRGRGGWWAALVVCALLSLGPWLALDGAWVELGGARVPLPARLIQLLSPDLAVTHARRFGAASTVVLAGLAGLGATRLWRARPALAVGGALLVGVEGLGLTGLPWPLPSSDAAIPPVYAELRGEPQDMVLDLPTDLGASMGTSRYLYYQTAHGQPLPYVPDARASTSSLMGEQSFQVLAARCARRPDEQAALRLSGLDAPLRPERLRAAGVRWIALHRALDPAATQALLAVLVPALGPGRELGDTTLWDLTGQPGGQTNETEQQ